jgi:CO dehydrogenase/acetyl-CoA synthase alpha subunit
MNKEKWFSVIRHTLTAVGAVVVAFGWLNEMAVMEVTGAIITVLSVVWGVRDKN